MLMEQLCRKLRARRDGDVVLKYRVFDYEYCVILIKFQVLL